jgi:hypothetical protein
MSKNLSPTKQAELTRLPYALNPIKGTAVLSAVSRDLRSLTSQARPSIRSAEIPYQLRSSSYQNLHVSFLAQT